MRQVVILVTLLFFAQPTVTKQTNQGADSPKRKPERPPAFVLIHSPLVGPVTWSPLADQLRKRRFEVIVPTLSDGGNAKLPYWKQHADAVAHQLSGKFAKRSVILVAHSGAGALLPAIRQVIKHPVAAYVFVDAVIPQDGKSRLDLIQLEGPQFADQMRRILAGGGRFPNWNEQILRPIIPDPKLRRRTLEELRPRDLSFFDEPIPVAPGWPDAPCGYLKFSPTYAVYAEQALRNGWRVKELAGGHFQMMVEPVATTSSLLQLLSEMNMLTDSGRSQ